MKKIYTFIALAIVAVSGVFAQTKEVSVPMGAGYANDVFYSYQNGVVAEVARAGWDIAFSTKSFDFNIITNDVSGIKLWQYPKTDITGWDNVDTTGLYAWPLLYNNDSSWFEGAFTRNALAHPDYGWGKYSDNDHNVYGDSIFLLQTTDAGGNPVFKKMAIVKLNTTTQTFSIKFANLDNTGLVERDIKASDYATKNFIYYSLSADKIVDREPEASKWDLVFTRWISSYYLLNNKVEQKITGVFTNPVLSAGKQTGFTSDAQICFFSATMKPDYRNILGGDWKTFNMGTFTYEIKQDIVFFTKNKEGQVYQVRFTGFSGSTTGTTTFKQTLLNAPAPVNFATYDMTNAFGWTDALPGMQLAAYEYTTDAGTNWMAVTANPQTLSNANYAAGSVMVRVKEDANTCTVVGLPLVSPIAFTENTGTTMSKAYVNDVFVSAANGVVKEVVRSGWDIAFTTKAFDSNIFTNDANGTKIWVYPKGKLADWNTVDTTGFYTWNVIYNIDSSWHQGAFSNTAKGHPDYGWGVYSDVDHNVYGDSIYIIRLEDGSNVVYKKLAIISLSSAARTFNFKYANLDGTDEQTVTLVAKNYDTKNYIYYSLRNNKEVDREPAATSWDFMFTRWISSFYWNNNKMEQKITGVYTNLDVEVGVQKGLTAPEQACVLSAEWKPEYRNIIGGDWKSFNMNTFAYDIKTDVVYFFKTRDLNIYQINFTSFAGTSTGNIGYELKLIEPLPTPTGATYNDVDNTFGWTYATGYETPGAYRVSVDGGTTWADATSNPINIGDIDLEAGKIMLTMPTDNANCRMGSDTLVSTQAYTKGTVGLAKTLMPDLAVFPVPAVDNLTISGLPVSSHISLFNILGVNVFEADVNSSITIPVANMPQGVYVLRIENKLGTFEQKVVIKQ